MAESLIFAESDWNIKAALSLINTLMSYRNNEILVEKLKESEIWAITEVFNSMNSERLAEFCKNTKISLETKICEAIGCIGIQTSDSSWYKRSFIMDAQTKIDEFEDHVNEQNIVIAEIKSYFRPKQCLQTKWGYYLLISIFWDFSKEARFYRNGKWIYLISKDSEPKLTENKEFKLAYLKVSEEDLNAIKADLENEVEIHLENSRQEKMISTIKEDKTYFEDPQKNIKKWTIKKISSDYSPAKANDMEIVAESLRKEMQANKELIQKNKVLQEEKQKINEELIKEKEKLGKAEDKCKGMAAILEEKELKEKDEIIQKMKNVQEESKKEQEKPPKLPEEPPKLFEEPPKPSEEPLELSEGSFGPFTIFNQRKLGLPNLINTCYFNAVLQALASNDRFVNYVRSIDSSFATALYRVFNIMREKKSENIEQALRSFKDQVNQEFPFLDSFGQQDSKEFLVCLLSKLEELSSVSLSNTTLIQEFLCMTCRKSYQNPEIQSFFTIPNNKKNQISTHLKELKAKVQHFRGDNMLYCQFCDTPRNMTITIKKIVCSEMLIFYLPANTNFSNAKIEEKLKVEDYEFSLYGVICYYGSGNSGHYTAYTKDGSVWRLYNDSSVSDKSYDAGNSYLVFYSLNKPRT